MAQSYQVEFVPSAIKDLQAIDRVIAQRIINKIKWLSENLDDITPEILAGKWRHKYKLRIGDWRIIYTIEQNNKLLTIHLIGHRREIYR
jgi:mRNA interferase RelE/StbE